MKKSLVINSPRLGEIRLPLGERTLIMGVLNLTPDSFSGDGLLGRATDDRLIGLAIERARQMIADGADIIDVGGESTRPGAMEVSYSDERARVIPIVEALASELRLPDGSPLPISVDTTKAKVAREALEAGASIVNDITALSDDPRMTGVCAEAGAGVIVMHMQGNPRTMQKNPSYANVVGEVKAFLGQAVERAARAGIARERVIVDPGIGFGKTVDHNLELLRNLKVFTDLGQPLLLGASRKGFIGNILGGAAPEERIEGTVATTILGIASGVDIVRVHDVRANARACRVADAVVRGYHG